MGRPLTMVKHPREPLFARAFGVRLSELYTKREMTSYQELAVEIGKILERNPDGRKAPTPGLVGQWLRGERTPTLISHVAALCEIFGVSSDYLLFGKENKEKHGFFTRLLKG